MLIQADPRESYHAFLENRLHNGTRAGFRPRWIPSWLFDFQAHLVEWAIEKGRCAIFSDCGTGKSPMELIWAQNVVEHTNKPVLLVAPLAVSAQMMREAEKFSIEAVRSQDGTVRTGARIVVTNYERLHLFDADAFIGIVCDESSVLKNFDGATKAVVTEFARRLPYRLLATATAAPNDYIELGTSSEALGEMGYTDMLTTFFKNREGSIEPLSYAAKWQFKPHAERPFWRWLCSWARALRKPSDLGFDDGAFILPPLTVTVQTVAVSRPFDGYLFIVPAQTLDEQRAERRATIQDRCEAVAAHATQTDGAFVAWCHLNDEADLLERLIPAAKQVSGSQSDEQKEELLEAFRLGQLRVLITKPKIAAHGLNWQHCAALSVFPSHSYEQYYQAIRRCWRFGQTRPVTVHVVTTAGEADVLGNLRRKSDAADRMFASMVEHMRDELRLARTVQGNATPTIPAWVHSWTN